MADEVSWFGAGSLEVAILHIYTLQTDISPFSWFCVHVTCLCYSGL